MVVLERSSVYEEVFSFSIGVGMSYIYKLKSVGENRSLWDPIWKVRVRDDLLWNVTCTCIIDISWQPNIWYLSSIFVLYTLVIILCKGKALKALY